MKKPKAINIGCEDYKNPSLYLPDPYYLTVVSEQAWWAWQFLRRNIEYQTDYQRDFHRILEKKRNWFRNNKNENFSDLYGDKDTLPDDEKFFLPSEDCAKKWGLSAYLNPKNHSPFYPHFTDAEPIMILEGICTEETKNTKLGDVFPDNYIVVGFNPDVSLDFQLEAVKREIRDIGLDARGDPLAFIVKEQWKQSRNWPLLLRIFDASHAGLRRKEIARKLLTFCSEADAESMVSEKLRQANQLIYKDYKIPFWISKLP